MGSKGFLVIGVVIVCLIIVGLWLTGFFTPAFEREKNFYIEKTDYEIEYQQTWSSWKTRSGEFTQVSKARLRREAKNLFESKGVLRLCIDRAEKVIWISGVGIGPDPHLLYVYWWTPK